MTISPLLSTYMHVIYPVIHGFRTIMKQILATHKILVIVYHLL